MFGLFQCFMNSILQCLSNTKPLLDYCLKEDYILDKNKTTSNLKGALIIGKFLPHVWPGIFLSISGQCSTLYSFVQKHKFHCSIFNLGKQVKLFKLFPPKGKSVLTMRK